MLHYPKFNLEASWSDRGWLALNRVGVEKLLFPKFAKMKLRQDADSTHNEEVVRILVVSWVTRNV